VGTRRGPPLVRGPQFENRCPIGAKLEEPKREPEEPRAEVGFPTADQGFSSIQGILFGFCGI